MWAIRQMTMQRFSGLLELDGWSITVIVALGNRRFEWHATASVAKGCCEGRGFDFLGPLLWVQPAEVEGCGQGDASLAMKYLHNDAPRSQRVGIQAVACRQAYRLVCERLNA